jgi:hypothetical protein
MFKKPLEYILPIAIVTLQGHKTPRFYYSFSGKKKISNDDVREQSKG